MVNVNSCIGKHVKYSWKVEWCLLVIQITSTHKKKWARNILGKSMCWHCWVEAGRIIPMLLLKYFNCRLYSYRHENESLGIKLKMRKNGQKCLKKPENQQNGAQKNLNSGLYLKILMPVVMMFNINAKKWPLILGMGFEAQVAHPSPIQIWVPPWDCEHLESKSKWIITTLIKDGCSCNDFLNH